MASLFRLVALLGAALFVNASPRGLAGLKDIRSRSDSHASANVPTGIREVRDDEGYPYEPLECFQVTSPVLAPEGLMTGSRSLGKSPADDAPACTQVLMDYHFANSYGSPFVANYTPPDCAFNRVVINFTVVSEGRQFDRLAVMYLTDTEVWRTSTAEPKADPGVSWTYWKDLTPFLSLWKKPQTLIFDLGNIVDDTYTGLFNTTMTASFFEYDTPEDQTPADLIVPVSAENGASGGASSFTFPQVSASSLIKLPRNVHRAVFSISANGQADEEFWWTNIPSSVASVFNSSVGLLPALSSFREVRLRIDGKIAGLSWPFPVIFTGGISPPLHRPIVGIQAFDLLEDEIDVTPWLGVLCDGKAHNVSLEVVGIDDTGKEPVFATVPMYWVLTGKFFLWLDDEHSVTTGSPPFVSIDQHIDINADVKTNVSLTYEQAVKRELNVKSRVKSQTSKKTFAWSQKFSMSNGGSIKDQANYQQVDALYSGSHKAYANSMSIYATEYRYPVSTTYVYKAPDGDYDLSLTADLSQGFNKAVTGKTVYPSGIEPFGSHLHGKDSGSQIDTLRNGTAFFYQYNDGKSSAGFGTMAQKYELSPAGNHLAGVPDLGVNAGTLLYSRNVQEVNETITHDEEYVYKKEVQTRPQPHGKPSSFQPKQDGGYAPVPAKSHGLLQMFKGKDQQSTGQKRFAKKATLQNRLLGDW